METFFIIAAIVQIILSIPASLIGIRSKRMHKNNLLPYRNNLLIRIVSNQYLILIISCISIAIFICSLVYLNTEGIPWILSAAVFIASLISLILNAFVYFLARKGKRLEKKYKELIEIRENKKALEYIK